jgi:hypothetical protein
MRIEHLERETLIRWQIDDPTFRVDFWTQIASAPPGSHGAPGYKQDSYIISEASLDEVRAWAADEAAGRSIVIYVSATLGREPGLIRLSGEDPTSIHY